MEAESVVVRPEEVVSTLDEETVFEEGPSMSIVTSVTGVKYTSVADPLVETTLDPLEAESVD